MQIINVSLAKAIPWENSKIPPHSSQNGIRWSPWFCRKWELWSFNQQTNVKSEIRFRHSVHFAWRTVLQNFFPIRLQTMELYRAYKRGDRGRDDRCDSRPACVYTTGDRRGEEHLFNWTTNWRLSRRRSPRQSPRQSLRSVAATIAPCIRPIKLVWTWRRSPQQQKEEQQQDVWWYMRSVPDQKWCLTSVGSPYDVSASEAECTSWSSETLACRSPTPCRIAVL